MTSLLINSRIPIYTAENSKHLEFSTKPPAISKSCQKKISKPRPSLKEVIAKIIKVIKKFFRVDLINLGLNVIDCAINVERAVRGFIGRAHLTHFTKYACGLDALSAILQIKDIVQLIAGSTKVAMKEKFQCAIQVISSIGALGGSVCDFMSFLSSVKVFAPIHALTVISPVSFVVESVILGLHIWDIHKARGHLKKFRAASGLSKKPSEFTVEDFRNGRKFIIQDQEKCKIKRVTSLTSKYFLGNAKKLNKGLEKIEQTALERLEKAQIAIESGDEEQAMEGQKLKDEVHQSLRKTMKTLNKRIVSTIWSRALSIVALAVTAVAIAVLTFTPFAPIGYTLLLGVTLGEIAKQCIYQKIKDRAFKKELLIA